jgi:NAD(P)-dependent dehydrogenase (short-subunit alcohol dehydrogenase family)
MSRQPENPFDLTGKVAVIIGGTSGIGLAITEALHDAGATVVPSSRTGSAVKRAAERFRRPDAKTLVCQADVNAAASLVNLRDRVLKTHGRVDILVNSAGVHLKVPTLSLTLKNWEKVLNTNLTGAFLACQVFAPCMLEKDWGRIINIASLGSFVSLHESTAYCVSKAGLVALTRSLGCEWARQGVTVNAIAPGVFRTSINEELLSIPERIEQILIRTPMFRVGKVSELGGAAIFLASEASAFMTGQVLAVDGGFLAAGITGNQNSSLAGAAGQAKQEQTGRSRGVTGRSASFRQ